MRQPWATSTEGPRQKHSTMCHSPFPLPVMRSHHQTPTLMTKRQSHQQPQKLRLILHTARRRFHQQAPYMTRLPLETRGGVTSRDDQLPTTGVTSKSNVQFPTMDAGVTNSRKDFPIQLPARAMTSEQRWQVKIEGHWVQNLRTIFWYQSSHMTLGNCKRA